MLGQTDTYTPNDTNMKEKRRRVYVPSARKAHINKEEAGEYLNTGQSSKHIAQHDGFSSPACSSRIVGRREASASRGCCGCPRGRGMSGNRSRGSSSSGRNTGHSRHGGEWLIGASGRLKESR